MLKLFYVSTRCFEVQAGQVVTVPDMKAYKGNKGMALLILHLAAKQR